MTGDLPGPGWGRLITVARRSLERTGGSLDAMVSLTNPTDEERRVVIGITGVYRSATASRLAVRLRDVNAFLVSAYGRTLPEVVADALGPLRDLPAQRRREISARQEMLDMAASSVHDGQEWFDQWIDEARADGMLTRFVRSGADFGRVIRVLDALPASEEPLPVFAERILGDTKALNDAALRAAVLRAVARRTGVDNPGTAEQERALWESVGVVPDDLASQVLVLNLPAVDGGVVASWLTSAAAAGLPMRITLHQLRLSPFTLAATDIFVTENPAVLRAATALGAAAPPLVCTEGIASAAVHRLLSYAPQARLWWRNDFDWPGVRMTGAALARYPNSRPWRMSAADYQAASDQGLPLRGTPVATPWDPALDEAMRRTGRAVMEERLISLLLDDLRGRHPGGWPR